MYLYSIWGAYDVIHNNLIKQKTFCFTKQQQFTLVLLFNRLYVLLLDQGVVEDQVTALLIYNTRQRKQELDLHPQ